MPDFDSRNEMLATIRALHDDLNNVVSRAGAANALLPEQFGEWSLKDVIAHMTGWRELTAARLEAADHPGAPPFPWGDRWPEDDVDAINAWLVGNSRSQSLAEVMAASDASFARVERALHNAGEAALLQPGRCDWVDWEDSAGLGRDVMNGTFEHHQEHMETIKPWLETHTMKEGEART